MKFFPYHSTTPHTWLKCRIWEQVVVALMCANHVSDWDGSSLDRGNADYSAGVVWHIFMDVLLLLFHCDWAQIIVHYNISGTCMWKSLVELTRGQTSFYQSSADLLIHFINTCKCTVLYLATIILRWQLLARKYSPVKARLAGVFN